MSASSLKLLVVGDLHHMERNRDSLYCARALELWSLLVAQVKERPPAAILQLGDLIDGYHLPIEVCRRDLLDVHKVLMQSPYPVHPLIGNHETIYLPDRPFILETLGLSAISRVAAFGAVRAVFFDLTVDGESYGLLTPERAAWLEAELDRAPERPAIILQHPLIHPDEETCGHRHYVQNSGAYLRLLARHPQVQMVLTGHRHIPTRLEFRGTDKPARRPGARRGPLVQLTLPAFCSWPFTYGALTVDEPAGALTFREEPLEPVEGVFSKRALEELLAEGRRIRIEENPDVWSARVRLSPELKEVTAVWQTQ
ncbi:MAG: metallophosphoesterase [Planctomycetes bacterium]|nr:metallophosphoesterase [Planctomycetota bacterium]